MTAYNAPVLACSLTNALPETGNNQGNTPIFVVKHHASW